MRKFRSNSVISKELNLFRIQYCQVIQWDFIKTKMGTNLLQLVPIHFLQPKSLSAPGYCYLGRLHLILANYLLPLTFGLSFLQQNL